MSKLARAMMMGAAGVPTGPKTYVDDVFNVTSVNNESAGAWSVQNGIDLQANDGFVMTKCRSNTDRWFVADTVTFTSEGQKSHGALNSSDKYANQDYAISSFNTDGFSYNDGYGGPKPYATYTFRKAEGFFDVVQFSGNGSSSGQTINHSLGSAPGMIWVKRLSGSENWCVWHKSTGNNWYFKLDQHYPGWAQNKISVSGTTSFQVMDSDAMINGSGSTYVAYIFADSDSGSATYGTGGNESIIKCGSFEGTAGTVVDCGFEPQFIFVKRVDGNRNSFVFDNMIKRGLVGVDGVNNYYLSTAASNGTSGDPIAESENRNIHITPTGFKVSTSTAFNNDTHVFMAIRRPNKPSTAGTQVYETLSYTGNGQANRHLNTVLDRVDMFFTQRMTGGNPYALDRLRRLSTYTGTDTSDNGGDQPDAVVDAPNKKLVVNNAPLTNSSSDVYALTLFKRAPGFMDVVCFTGNGTAGRQITHGLGATPEMILVKTRAGSGNPDNWQVYHSALGATKFLQFNRTSSVSTNTNRWNDTTPTSTVFTVGDDPGVNSSSLEYFAYLFASLDNISKVGSYTGNAGYDVNVDCGFTNGARYILIKNSDKSADPADGWYVFNTARGITSGNDPYTWINKTQAETTSNDWIDPLNAGFTVTSTAGSDINVSGDTYVFLAVA